MNSRFPTLISATTAIALSMSLWAASVFADTASDAALEEAKKMLGGVPTELQLYPESARAAAWQMMKSTDLNENTALPSKVRELIGLAVAAQIPCEYCVHYHIGQSSGKRHHVRSTVIDQIVGKSQ